MMGTTRVETRQSGNKKYTQLNVDDLVMLRKILGKTNPYNPLGLDDDELDLRLIMFKISNRLFNSVTEVIERARATPEPRICLAYAVKRGTGPKRVFKDIELKEK